MPYCLDGRGRELPIVGAGAVGLLAKGAVNAARAGRFAATVEKAANGANVLRNVSGKLPAILKTSRFGERLFNSKVVGATSRLFGDIHASAPAKGLLNRGSKWAIGWSADSVKKTLPKVIGISNRMNAARAVFRIKVGGIHLPVWYGP